MLRLRFTRHGRSMGMRDGIHLCAPRQSGQGARSEPELGAAHAGVGALSHEGGARAAAVGVSLPLLSLRPATAAARLACQPSSSELVTVPGFVVVAPSRLATGSLPRHALYAWVPPSPRVRCRGKAFVTYLLITYLLRTRRSASGETHRPLGAPLHASAPRVPCTRPTQPRPFCIGTRRHPQAAASTTTRARPTRKREPTPWRGPY